MEKEQLEQQIETWDGVNKYIVRDAKMKLREIEPVSQPIKKEEVEAPAPKQKGIFKRRK